MPFFAQVASAVVLWFLLALRPPGWYIWGLRRWVRWRTQRKHAHNRIFEGVIASKAPFTAPVTGLPAVWAHVVGSLETSAGESSFREVVNETFESDFWVTGATGSVRVRLAGQSPRRLPPGRHYHSGPVVDLPERLSRFLRERGKTLPIDGFRRRQSWEEQSLGPGDTVVVAVEATEVAAAMARLDSASSYRENATVQPAAAVLISGETYQSFLEDRCMTLRALIHLLLAVCAVGYFVWG